MPGRKERKTRARGFEEGMEKGRGGRCNAAAAPSFFPVGRGTSLFREQIYRRAARLCIRARSTIRIDRLIDRGRHRGGRERVHMHASSRDVGFFAVYLPSGSAASLVFDWTRGRTLVVIIWRSVIEILMWGLIFEARVQVAFPRERIVYGVVCPAEEHVFFTAEYFSGS